MRELAVGPWGWEKSAAKSRVHCLSRARRPFTAERLDDVGPPPAADGKGRGDYPAAQEAAVRPLVNAIIATAFRQYCDSVPIGALLNPRATTVVSRGLGRQAVGGRGEAALRHPQAVGIHQRGSHQAREDGRDRCMIRIAVPHALVQIEARQGVSPSA